jgi:hypothetical protein
VTEKKKIVEGRKKMKKFIYSRGYTYKFVFADVVVWWL